VGSIVSSHRKRPPEARILNPHRREEQEEENEEEETISNHIQITQ
jgi:hypothetical protein